MAETSVRGRLEELAAALAGKIPGLSGGDGADMSQPERIVRAAKVLSQAGVIKAENPATAAKAVRTLLQWDMTPAAGFVVSALRFPDEPAIVDEKGELTFGEVDKRTNALSRALGDEGVGPDDSVAIMCRDHRWFVE